jgi:predicted RNA polymerase sigma factor
VTVADLESTWRACAPDVLGAVVRGHGDFEAAEDAVQETLLAAARQWPHEGVPDNPTGWLITVASRRLVDQARSERSRATREQLVVRRQQGREPPARRLTGMTPALATNRSRSCCCAVTRGSRGRRRWR